MPAAVWPAATGVEGAPVPTGAEEATLEAAACAVGVTSGAADDTAGADVATVDCEAAPLAKTPGAV